MAHEVFISYCSEDKNIADAVCAGLEAEKIACWIAPRDVPPGANYGAAIIDAINETRIMVVIFSSRANQSRHVSNEIERAVSNGDTVIPFRIEDVLPSKGIEFFISSCHWLDAMSPPVEGHVAKLATAVKANLGCPPEKPDDRKPILSADSVGSPEASQIFLPGKASEKGEPPLEQLQTSRTKRPALLRPPFIFILLALISAVLIVAVASRDRIIPFIQPATAVINLSGTWDCNDGATYTIQQKGRRISWTGANPPHFANSFDGSVTDQGYIEGDWHDLPGYAAYSYGKLTLKIDDPLRLVRVSQTGNFSGSIWTKRP